MGPADDGRSVKLGDTLKLDLSAVKALPHSGSHDESLISPHQEITSPYSSQGRYGLVQSEPLSGGVDALVSVERKAVDLTVHAGNTESSRTEQIGAHGLYQVSHTFGTAAGSDTRTHANCTNAEKNNVIKDNLRRSSNGALSTAGLSSSDSRPLKRTDNSRRQVIDIVLPNSSPARLEGSPRKTTVFQKVEPRSSIVRGSAEGGANIGKFSSFSAPATVKSRTVKVVLEADAAATGNWEATRGKPNNPHGISKHDGRADKVVASGSTSSSDETVHHKDTGEEQLRHVRDVQEEAVVKEELGSNKSDESESGEDDEGEEESGGTESCYADCRKSSTSDIHSDGEDGSEPQETTEGCPGLVETEIDGTEEEQLDTGELRYNMRTGKFSRAYVVRGLSGHGTPIKQRHSTVCSEKGPESSWIFPWEVRPDIDVFAAAAAAAAASSARQQQLRPSRRVSSAPAVPSSCRYHVSPGGMFREGSAGDLHRQKRSCTMQFQRREMEEYKRSERIICERQKESVFDYLSKMAQANEWAQMMRTDRNYRAFKTRDGKLACHVYQGKSYVKRLPMEVFTSYEYPRLRRRYKLCFPSSHIQVPAATGSKLNETEVRMRRQLELQNVLLSTIQLTHALKEQLDFVERASSEYPRRQLR